MRNHHEKARDVARSVLPSTARRAARARRAAIHRRERALERRLLHDLVRSCDPDDVVDDVGAVRRSELGRMVADRRAADKVGPLLHWAERTVERDPTLAGAPFAVVETRFRAVLPAGLIGEHALSHLRWVLDPGSRYAASVGARRRRRAVDDVALVEDVIAAGRHGDLNRRIRAVVAPVVHVAVRLPATRVVDDEHPAPGRLVPARNLTVARARRVRFLAGAHDAASFVADAERDVLAVLRAFHDEVVGPGGRRRGR